MKIEQIKKQMHECQREIDKCNGHIEDTERGIAEMTKDWNEKEARLVVLREKIKNFDKYRQDELEKVKLEAGLAKAENDFKRIENEIKAAIELTGLAEDDISKFLTLTQELLNATRFNQEQACKLS